MSGVNHYEIIKQTGFCSAAQAYNDAIDRCSNDLIIFAHQDLFLPETWAYHLENSLDYLDRVDPDWGVLGCWGATQDGKLAGHIYSTGLGMLGQFSNHPIEVRTLDEVLLILRKSSGLRFDISLPHFHFYGTDICLSAEEKGRKSYAISAVCVHNTKQLLVLPEEFYESCRHIRRRWWYKLPVQTTCIKVSRFNLGVLERRLREAYLRVTGRHETGEPRSRNGPTIWSELSAPHSWFAGPHLS